MARDAGGEAGRERQARADIGRHLGRASAAIGDLGHHLPQPHEAQQASREHEGVVGCQRAHEPFLDLTQHRAAPKPQLDHRRLDDGADVHPVLAGDAGVADMNEALRVTEQLGEALIDLQRVAAILDEAQHGVEGRAVEPGIGRGAGDFGEGVIRVEGRRTGEAQQMLGEHVEPAGAGRIAVLLARRDALARRLAFQHLETVGGHKDGDAGLVHAVVGAADALEQAGNPLRRADLDHLIDAAPVDSEIERGGGDHRAQSPLGHRRFHAATLRHIEAAVMDGDRQRIFVNAPDVLEQQLGLGTGVDEDDGEAGGAHTAPECPGPRRGPYGRTRADGRRAA